MLKSLDAIQGHLGAASKDIWAEKWYDLRCNSGRLPKTSASSSLIPLVWVSYHSLILIPSHLLLYFEISIRLVSQVSTLRTCFFLPQFSWLFEQLRLLGFHTMPLHLTWNHRPKPTFLTKLSACSSLLIPLSSDSAALAWWCPPCTVPWCCTLV